MALSEELQAKRGDYIIIERTKGTGRKKSKEFVIGKVARSQRGQVSGVIMPENIGKKSPPVAGLDAIDALHVLPPDYSEFYPEFMDKAAKKGELPTFNDVTLMSNYVSAGVKQAMDDAWERANTPTADELPPEVPDRVDPDNIPEDMEWIINHSFDYYVSKDVQAYREDPQVRAYLAEAELLRKAQADAESKLMTIHSEPYWSELGERMIQPLPHDIRLREAWEEYASELYGAIGGLDQELEEYVHNNPPPKSKPTGTRGKKSPKTPTKAKNPDQLPATAEQRKAKDKVKDVKLKSGKSIGASKGKEDKLEPSAPASRRKTPAKPRGKTGGKGKTRVNVRMEK